MRVDLLSVDEKETEAEVIEAETTVRLAEDGKAAPVEFEVARQDQGNDVTSCERPKSRGTWTLVTISGVRLWKLSNGKRWCC